MRVSRIALLLAAAAALQFLFGASRYRGAWPVDWFLIATASVARGGDFSRAVLAGATAGLIEDGLSHQLLGMNAFAKAAIGYLLAAFSIRVMFGGAWAVGAALALSSLANDAIVAVLANLLLQQPVVLGSFDSMTRAAATGVMGGALEAAWRFPWREWWERRRLRRLR